MPDAATITAVFSSLKTATEIAKLLRESNVSFEKAELRLKLADLVGSLADARLELTAVQEELAAKGARIAELEAAFAAKDDLIRQGDAYYRKSASGTPIGTPLCLRCWDVDHRQRQLVNLAGNFRIKVCTVCETQYEGRRASSIAEPPAPSI